MPATRAPYSLDAPTFRFPALATQAARAPLGGPREIALASYVIARLADDVLPEREVASDARAERATAAKRWIGSLALPAQIRTAMTEVVAASAITPASVAEALARVIVVTAAHLEPGASLELVNLARLLDAQPLA